MVDLSKQRKSVFLYRLTRFHRIIYVFIFYVPISWVTKQTYKALVTNPSGIDTTICACLSGYYRKNTYIYKEHNFTELIYFVVERSLINIQQLLRIKCCISNIILDSENDELSERHLDKNNRKTAGYSQVLARFLNLCATQISEVSFFGPLPRFPW